MTIVVAKKMNDYILFCFDQMVANHYIVLQKQQADLSKVIQINGLTIGVSGMFRTLTVLEIFAKENIPASPSEQAIQEWLWKFKGWAAAKDHDFTFEDCFLIAFKDRLFHVTGINAKEVTEYSAIGSGSDFAIAILFSGLSVEKSVEIAIQLDPYCSGEIQTVIHHKQLEVA